MSSIDGIKILAIGLSSESHWTCVERRSCFYFLTKPLKTPLIESLDFYDFGTFHNRFFFYDKSSCIGYDLRPGTHEAVEYSHSDR